MSDLLLIALKAVLVSVFLYMFAFMTSHGRLESLLFNGFHKLFFSMTRGRCMGLSQLWADECLLARLFCQLFAALLTREGLGREKNFLRPLRLRFRSEMGLRYLCGIVCGGFCLLTFYYCFLDNLNMEFEFTRICEWSIW